ncbi:glycosyltransferase family 39 protein [uncultured Rhodoblastus sp.]|uniref:ArnT family glycosyltransferase n=1 Tax=uncultured Rhodoblastus sp. TaxID=543037 RepID=UPI0025D0C7A7|nr:glycosyltransferase family 39 protein [uncultured Rhodoblastus sp.]
MNVPKKDGFFKEIAIFGGLALLTLLLRAPFAANIGEDEAFFAVIGRDWPQGILPYAGRFDVKPPGLFLLYALAGQILGSGVAAIKGLEIIFVAASAYGLWRIGRDHFSRPVGMAAATLYPLYSLAMSGVNAPVALFLNGFEIFAVLAALGAAGQTKAPWRQAGMSGLLFGCAFTIKQTAAFEAGAVAIALSLQAPTLRIKTRCFVAFAVAGAVAPLVFAGYFLAQRQFAALWTNSVLAAMGRLGGDQVGFLEGLARLPGGLRPIWLPLAGAVLTLLRWPALSRGPLAGPLRLCLFWLGGALLALVAMRAMYDHYFLPLVPPLLLLGAVACFNALDFRAQAERARMALLAAAALCPMAAGFDDWRQGGEDRPALRAASMAAVAAGLAPGDRALVVNRGVQFYNETGAAPAGRIFHPQHLLCDFPGLRGDTLAEAMAARPPFILLADTRLGMVCEKAERLERLLEILREGYELAAHAAGDWDSYDLYRLADKKVPAG